MEYENMTVAELKELLRAANLPVSGKKAELITRLQESKDIPKLVGVCLGVMGVMFVTVYVGVAALLQFLPAVESVVG